MGEQSEWTGTESKGVFNAQSTTTDTKEGLDRKCILAEEHQQTEHPVKAVSNNYIFFLLLFCFSFLFVCLLVFGLNKQTNSRQNKDTMNRYVLINKLSAYRR